MVVRTVVVVSAVKLAVLYSGLVALRVAKARLAARQLRDQQLRVLPHVLLAVVLPAVLAAWLGVDAEVGDRKDKLKRRRLQLVVVVLVFVVVLPWAHLLLKVAWPFHSRVAFLVGPLAVIAIVVYVVAHMA